VAEICQRAIKLAISEAVEFLVIRSPSTHLVASTDSRLHIDPQRAGCDYIYQRSDIRSDRRLFKRSGRSFLLINKCKKLSSLKLRVRTTMITLDI